VATGVEEPAVALSQPSRPRFLQHQVAHQLSATDEPCHSDRRSPWATGAEEPAVALSQLSQAGFLNFQVEADHPGTTDCYTAQIMKRTLFVLLLATGALAQNHESTLRQEGSDALSREQARSKQELCAEAEKDGNPEIGRCLDEQFKTTEQNYLAYVRSIGALLRLSLPDDSALQLGRGFHLTPPKMRGSGIAMQAANRCPRNGPEANPVWRMRIVVSNSHRTT
jgi:hypothetical protein